MKTQNFSKGRLGEQIASQYLKKKGYRILEQNFRTRYGEIDIISAKDKLLAFVEVKLKVGKNFGLPEEMITPGKLGQVRKIAEVYLQQNPKIAAKYEQYRIDAVCIVLNEDYSVKDTRHYENVAQN